jgi:hypothetical protein
VNWEFRFRGPRMVETVTIETLGDTEAEARDLAQKHLAGLNTPSANFIWVRKAVAQRSADYPDLVEKYGAEAKKTAAKPAAAKPASDDRPLQAAASGRIGA